jgi:hypothetical protein
VGREVERLGIEQHQLLFEPDGGLGVPFERRAQISGGGQRIGHGRGG